MNEVGRDTGCDGPDTPSKFMAYSGVAADFGLSESRSRLLPTTGLGCGRGKSPADASSQRMSLRFVVSHDSLCSIGVERLTITDLQGATYNNARLK